MELKIFSFNGTVEDFMKTEQYKSEVLEPANDYYDTVYKMATSKLSPLQKLIYDDWYAGKPIPSDDCYWKKTDVPEGYEKFTPEDIYQAHNMILWTVSMGCG